MWFAAPLLISNLFLFVYHYRNEDLNSSFKTKSVVTIPFFLLSLILGLLSLFTNLVIEGTDPAIKKIFYGDIYPVIVLFIVIVTIGIFWIIRSHRHLNNIKTKISVNIVYSGIIITLISTLLTNILLPIVLGNSRLSFLGIFTSIPINLAIAYSILKYKLFETRILFGRLIYISVLTIVLMAGFYISFIIDTFLWGGVFNINALLTGIPVGITFLLIYDKLRISLQSNVTKRVLNSGYDPSEQLAKYNIQISNKLDTDEISESLFNTLNTTLRPKYFSIYFTNLKRKLISNLKNNFPNIFNEDEIIEVIKVFQLTKFEPLNYDLININPNNSSHNLDDLMKIKNILERHNIRLMVPILDPKELIGILILGEENISYPYESGQLDFITNLAKITGVAFARSKLYEEVEVFNLNLKKEVEIATKEIQQKNQELSEQLRKEKDMMDILGHELRTPLSIARNAVAMMKSAIGKVDESDTQFELNNLYTKALENIRREVKILETVLSSTRIENNRVQIIMEKVDIKDVVNVAIEGNTSDSTRKGIKLYSVFGEGEIIAFAARDQVQEVVDNLVSNAVKYTEKGEIRVEAYKENGYVVVTVKDTGEGIPEDAIPNLGKKFFRVNTYLSDGNERMNVIRPGGTGIGLYVVFNLVKLMRGTIEIKSKVGVGSNFTIRLPGYNVVEREIKPSNNI